MSRAGLEPATHWLKERPSLFQPVTAITIYSHLLQVAAASDSMYYHLVSPTCLYSCLTFVTSGFVRYIFTTRVAIYAAR